MLFTTYQARVGRPIATAGGLTIFTFGSECNDVSFCSKTDEIVKSADMCMFSTGESAYISASYHAHPKKLSGKIQFSSTLVTKPRLFPNLQGCGGVGIDFFSI